MASCLVPNCKSKTKFKSLQQFKDETELGKSISFFKFPSCPKMQNKWLNKLFDKQASDIKLSQESRICEKHFASTDFIEYNYTDAILKETAVPKLYRKSIDWVRCAKSKLASIKRDVEDIDINWLTISDSINVDRNVKCRFCLKTKKDMILNCWQEISTPKFKEIYLQVTGSEIHTSDKLPQFCCIFCYDRLNEAANTMLHFQKCHLKWQKVLHEMQKKTIESLQSNENDVKEVLPPEILDLHFDYNSKSIKDANIDNNDSRDEEKINKMCTNDVIAPEMLNSNSDDNNIDTFEDDNRDYDECSDQEKLNGVESTTKKKKPNPMNKIVCRCCGEITEGRREFVVHMKTQHNEHFLKKEFSLRCDYCSLKYATELELKDHIEIHHKGQSLGSLECQLCFSCISRSKAGYARHIYSKHPNLRGEPIVNYERPAVSSVCTICNKVSKSASLLVKHMYLVHKPKTIRCDVCGQMFINESRRKLHMLKHTGERLFVCEACGMNFLKKRDLLNHQKRVHGVVNS